MGIDFWTCLMDGLVTDVCSGWPERWNKLKEQRRKLPLDIRGVDVSVSSSDRNMPGFLWPWFSPGPSEPPTGDHL
jgi:hypothetical protein